MASNKENTVRQPAKKAPILKPNAKVSEVEQTTASIDTDANVGGREKRSNRGVGGHITQLEKTANIVGAALEKKVVGSKKQANKHPQVELDNPPENMEENAMAPHKKRSKKDQGESMQLASTHKALLSFRIPVRKEASLKIAPLPQRHMPPDLSQTLPKQGPSKGPSKIIPNSKGPENDVDSDQEDERNQQMDLGDNIEEEDDEEEGDNAEEPSQQQEGIDYGFFSDDPELYPGGQEDISDVTDIHESQRGPALFLQDMNGGIDDDGFDEDQFNSPSDDERLAQDALKHGRKTQSNSSDEEDEEDESQEVLRRHHAKNRSNRPPQQHRLTAAASLQKQRQHTPASDEDVDIPAQPEVEHRYTDRADENEEPSDSDIENTQADQHSKATQIISPDTLTYYPKGWRIVIVCAKLRYRLHTSITTAFPTKENAAQYAVARQILSEEIAKGKDEEINLERGYDFSEDMVQVVWQESSTFRGKMKTMAIALVEHNYGDLLSPLVMGNQEGIPLAIQYNVEQSLKFGDYLVGPKDAQGKTSNFEHPCIEKLCVNFFYTGITCLAADFPNLFKDTLPEGCWVMAMTCIDNCLREYEATGRRRRVKFLGENCRYIATAIEELIIKVKANAYHHQKMIDNLQKIARAGMKVQNPKKITPTSRLRVILD